MLLLKEIIETTNIITLFEIPVAGFESSPTISVISKQKIHIKLFSREFLSSYPIAGQLRCAHSLR